LRHNFKLGMFFTIFTGNGGYNIQKMNAYTVTDIASIMGVTRNTIEGIIYRNHLDKRLIHLTDNASKQRLYNHRQVEIICEHLHLHKPYEAFTAVYSYLYEGRSISSAYKVNNIGATRMFEALKEYHDTGFVTVESRLNKIFMPLDAEYKK